MSRESGVFCHGGHRLQQFWNKNINICFHSENSIVLLKNHILYFGEENGKKENSVIGLQHHVGNLRKYEKWIRGIYWLQQCFLPKIFHFLQMFDLASKVLGEFWLHKHTMSKGVYLELTGSILPTCSWLLFIFIGWRKNVGHFFLEEVFEKLKCCLFVGCDNILLMCLFVRTDSRRLKFCPAARFLHLLALYVIVNDMPCEKERTSLYIVYACAEVYLFLFYIKIHACDKRFVSETNIF